MPVETRKPLGLGGLNLGADPAQARNALVIANGARYDIAGVITGRLGRKRLGLEFPYEGLGVASDYVQTIAHLKSPDRTRGIGAFYDQRIVMRPPETLSEGEFDTTLKWSRTGDFNFATDENALRVAAYAHSTGIGTITQTVADFLSPAFGSSTYALEYTITFNDTPAGSSFALRLLSGFANQDIVLPFGIGRYRIEFTSAAVPGNFVIRGTSILSVPPAGIDIGNVSLKLVAPALISVPQRLNFVYKFADKLYLNDSYAGSADLILQGDGTFNNLTTRAKIVARSDAVFVVDPANKPKIMRRLPVNSQRFLKRVKYKAIQCGIDYPQSDKDRCRAAFSTDATKRLQPGVYRFRTALENEFGDVSEPSLVSREVVVVTNQFATVSMPAIPSTMPGSQVTRWRVYVSFHPGSVDTSAVPATLVLTATEPTEFKYWKSIATSVAQVQFTGADALAITDHPGMTAGHGAPPKYRDFMILNDVGYGIAEPDTIKREVAVTEGTGAPLLPSVDSRENQFSFQHARLDLTTVKEIDVDPTYLFISPPGEPQYARHLLRFCSGDEVGIGLSHIGDSPVILTNLGIIVYFPAERALKRTPSEIGCLSRDSIKRTERGIRFMGTDGIMRLFNGATVDEIADELLPVFSKEDYRGYYPKFDRGFAHEATGENGNHKFFMSYPVTRSSSTVPGKPEIDSTPERNMLVGDTSKQGRTTWAIDTTGYEQLLWLGRESRMAAVDFDGSFYFIEEGFGDQGNGVPDRPPPLEIACRWFGATTKSRFTAIKVEIDTKGKDVTLVCQVDSLTDATREFTLNTTGRQDFERNLPAHFKGLYLEARISGATDPTAGRPEIFDIKVESVPFGGF